MMEEMVTEQIAEAFRQARLVRKCLDARIIPILPPRQRTFTTELSRRLARGEFLNEVSLLDLEALLAQIGSAVDEGTTIVWRGHEQDPDCGYAVPVRSDNAQGLLIVQSQIVDLITAIEGALDAVRACAMAARLLSE